MSPTQAAVFVAGHRGMAGSAIVRRLRALGYANIITSDRDALDLCDQSAVRRFFAERKIDQVYLAAGRVGGIVANDTAPADFLYDNLMIAANVIHAAHSSGVNRLLYLGASCLYPRQAAQPMQESALLTGALEPTNEPYAIAKIAGIKLCESMNRQHGRDYRSVLPTNLYGPNDNFHPQHSHVLPALMRRFHEAAQSGAAEVVVWGSGQARREFMHVDDMAAACEHVMALPPERYRALTAPQASHLNIGTGIDCSIAELAALLARVTGFSGRIVFDAVRPEGAPRKLLDVSALAASGWRAGLSLEAGLRDAYDWFVAHQDRFRG